MTTDADPDATKLARDSAPQRPFPTMIDPDEALQRVQQAAVPGDPCAMPPGDAAGLRLAQDVNADRDYPAFDRAMMDGYAVRLADAGDTVEVTGEIAAGTAPQGSFGPGRSVEIMTGAPCPAAAEAVVPRENTTRSGDRVTLPRRLLPGQHIAVAGSECAAGATVVRHGDVVTPLAVAVMASFGVRQVRVYPPPSVGIVTTGAELVGPDVEPAPGQIRDSNGPMLSALAGNLGLQQVSLRHAEDRLEAIVEAIRAVADRRIVLLTGGVSMGNHDLVPDAVQRYGAEVVFHKARQKPGKPLLFARRGSQLLFGLPGNPLACHFCFHRYVAAAVRRIGGQPAPQEVLAGELSEPAQPKSGRTFFMPAVATWNARRSRWLVRPTPGVSSADVFGACRANCYLQVPPGRDEIPPGQTLSFTWLVAAGAPAQVSGDRDA